MMGERITSDFVFSRLLKREKITSKYDYGTLLAVCGSQYYRGAAMLSASAALRCGTGIVCLASTEKVVSFVANLCPECTFLPLEESENGSISHRSTCDILKKAKRCNTVLLGCGLSLDDDIRYVVQRIVTSSECQFVLDADALNVLSECPELLKETKKTAIITPHFSEMARLSGKSKEEIAKAPEKSALDFASRYNCIVVLKSHITYIATPDGKCFINDKAGNPGLAKGGSGDVLAGMIASFVSQGISPVDSAVCGVYLHGVAADRCAERLSEYAMLPSDVVAELCGIFKENGR